MIGELINFDFFVFLCADLRRLFVQLRQRQHSGGLQGPGLHLGGRRCLECAAGAGTATG